MQPERVPKLQSSPFQKHHFIFSLACGSFCKPRVCGEKLNTPALLPLFQGSPPHMRGKVRACGACQPPAGITPAYAGKSLLAARARISARDHPRVCGEKAYSKVMPGSLWGSPPHVRGKGHLTLAVSHMHRINPAYAGKRDRLCFPVRCKRDHPRVCGEKWFKLTRRRGHWGSPPRMRGKGQWGE